MKKSGKLWQSLIEAVVECGAIDSAEEYFRALADWARRNRNAFPQASWRDYGLESLTSLQPERYPVAASEQPVVQDIDRLGQMTPGSADSIAMLVRDRLWNLAVLKTTVDCPRCGDDCLRALFHQDEPPPSLLLACDLCGWTQRADGRSWEGAARARPATTEELKAGGYTAERK